MHQGRDSTRKRVSNACQRCRKHKIKCSGSQPCKTCENRGIDCEFDIDDRKVLVSERHLHHLRTRLRLLENQRSRSELQNSDLVLEPENGSLQADDLEITLLRSVPDETDALQNPILGLSEIEDAQGSPVATTPDHTGVSNPLVPERPTFLSDPGGRLRYLGPSSTWSFSRQVLHLAQRSPPSNPFPDSSIHADQTGYDITPKATPKFDPTIISGLPSLDLSLYYMQSVKFRTHPLYHVFDENDFTKILRQFYRNPASVAATSSLWFVHYLVVMALGRAIVSPLQSHEQNPSTNVTPGSELFNRALKALPDVHQLSNYPVEAAEVLCCFAIYSQSIDHRTAAHIYIGQALRLALSHGLHTDIQAEEIGSDLARRGRRIWRTIYSLDRKISCSMGVPVSLRDEDMASPFPVAEDEDDSSNAVMINLKISQLLSTVMSNVYIAPGLDKTFLKITQTVLKGVAGLFSELKLFSENCFGEISRVASHLELAYHQCIMLCSRPVLFYVLSQRLENPDRARKQVLSSQFKGLVQVCIDSALQAITILYELRRFDLLDTFLPFDLESTFSASFILLMANSIHPKLLPHDNWLGKIMEVLDTIISKGNILAVMRKMEVEQLSQALEASLPHRRRNDDQVNLGPNGVQGIQQGPFIPSPDHASLPSLGDPFFDEWNPDNGLSGGQIMTLADALDVGNFDDDWMHQTFE